MATPDVSFPNLPPGMTGVAISTEYEPTPMAIARAHLQVASLALIRHLDRPDTLQLEFTPAGAAEPVISPPNRTLGYLPMSWVGDQPAISGYRLPGAPAYSFEVNAVGATPAGAKLVDRLSYEVILPTTQLPGGAIALHGITRFYRMPPSVRRRPDLFASAPLNHGARTVRRATNVQADAAGNRWQWSVNAY